MTKRIERHRMDRRIFELLFLGRGVKSICKELKVGKDRVREVREKAKALGFLDGSASPPLAPHPLFPDSIDGRELKTSEHDRVLLSLKDWIVERLITGWSPITVFEELPVIGVGRSSFYRFMERHSLSKLASGARRHSLIAPIIHEPGEALILDWGKIRDVFDPKTQTKRALWAFIGVLGFSRYMMVRLVWSNDSLSTFDSLERMLQEIGGVPDRMTTDNPKCFALQASKYDPLLNPAFQRFAAHYDFKIECLPPADPQKKGKVERIVPFARRIFEAYPQDFVSLKNAQEYMDRKVGIANCRRHGTTTLKPIIVFTEKEKTALKPLPALACEKEQVCYPTVRRDGFIRFANKYYAVSDDNIEQEVVVLATQTKVSIYKRGELLEVYDRITDTYQTHAIKDHLKKQWQKIEENNLHYLEHAQRIGPDVSRLIHIFLTRGEGFIDTRKIWGILSLEKKYPKELINNAVRVALELGELSSRYVEKLIHLEYLPKTNISEEEKSLNLKTTGVSKFSRPMTVYTEQLSLLKQ
jgi:hypothetical protein